MMDRRTITTWHKIISHQCIISTNSNSSDSNIFQPFSTINFGDQNRENLVNDQSTEINSDQSNLSTLLINPCINIDENLCISDQLNQLSQKLNINSQLIETVALFSTAYNARFNCILIKYLNDDWGVEDDNIDHYYDILNISINDELNLGGINLESILD